MEEAVDEFGRPLRPNRDSSSDSDSDREYDRYRKRRDRYSPDRYQRGGRDHSPERRRRSPSPSQGYRGRGRNRGDDNWDNYRNNRNGYPDDINGHQGHHGHHGHHSSNSNNSSNNNTSSITPSGHLASPNSTPSGKGAPSSTASSTSTPKRQKKGDIFEGGYFRSYKQFLDYQDDQITAADADKKYEEYKVEYSKRQSRVFFKEHQNEEWFKEKYDPVFLAKKRKEKVEKSKSLVSTFSLNLNDENHKFSLESKDNIKEGDKLDLDGLDMHHHEPTENTNNSNNTNSTEKTEEDQNEETKMEEDDKNEKSIASNNNNATTPTITSLTKSSINAASNINDKDKSTLFIKAVSPACTKDELLEVLNKVAPAGEQSVVTKLTLSEPVRYKNFYRLGWVTYKNCDLAAKALKELNGYKMKDFDLYLNINKPSEDAERRFKITPHIASTENRIYIDLEQSTTLMRLFDQNKGITNNPIESFEKWNQLTSIEKLDRTILYLRYVHFYCYYCSEEFSDECETIRKCGTIHLRRSPGETTSISIEKKEEPTTTTTTTTSTTNDEQMETENNKSTEQIEKIKKNSEDENNNLDNIDNSNNIDENNKENDEENKEENMNIEESKDELKLSSNNNITSTESVDNKPKLTTESEQLWVTSLDNNTKNKIARIPTSNEQYLCKEAIEKAAEDYINNNTIKIEEEKYKCNLCSKLFKGAEYVKKHINLKHPEELKNESETKGTEEQFFLNYFSDPRRITPLPPPQQQPPNAMYAGFGGGAGRGLPPGIAGQPRARFNPTIGQWEPIFQPIGILPPGMLPNQPMVQLMSPVFASPNGIRGRGPNGVPPHGIVPMRRSYGGSTVSGAGGNLSPNPRGGYSNDQPSSSSARYRPYPNQSRHSTSSSDPRGIREYVDLDAPMDHVPEIDYRSALKEYQNKKSL
ncbi:hypothetical protein DICPUDRAFT_58394 [Dictyostelium purpureum]|uniref:C2H2-type domain-containing protein n=1 Tax=Dictyostelium purpureum TaxID=5786 RepID=F1A0R1_DICPU|nr:uncharacterized protein DICPUDRAFT_58394 [Dictyostelium purpureum]EGC30217.1 hypothetical protein DICPUDRAFT_58394 [Dictyostelium purpureum]|eukprot:XP_003293253.1 hypothetical protein DICPUDRAFT_58394 [Dictyostelium purpureum]